MQGCNVYRGLKFFCLGLLGSLTLSCDKGFKSLENVVVQAESEVASPSNELVSSNETTRTINSETAPLLIEKSLLKVKLRFLYGHPSTGFGVIQQNLQNNADYKIYFNELPIVPGTSPVIFIIDDPIDQPTEVESFDLLTGSGQHINSGVFIQPITNKPTWTLVWDSFSEKKTCNSINNEFIIPSLGQYILKATYKDGKSRIVNFNLSDPCTNILSVNLDPKIKLNLKKTPSLRLPASVKETK